MRSRILLLLTVSMTATVALSASPWLPLTRSAPSMLFVTAIGSDSASCSEAQPCRSLGRAYNLAGPGQIVLVAGGTYGDQTLGGAHSGPRVVFKAAAGAKVTLDHVSVYGSHVEIDDMAFAGGLDVKSGADDVVFRHVDSEDLFISSASNISFIGGSVGPTDSYDPQVVSRTASSPPPTNILIDGVRFHDMTRRKDPSAHIECLQFGSGVNVTIRNSRFENCATQDLFVRSWGPGYPIRDFTIENNFFDKTDEGYYTLKVGQTSNVPYSNILVRNNSALQPLLVDSGAGSGVRFVNNVAPRSSSACFRDQVFVHNVWDGARCSASDRNAPSGFADPASLDLHLVPGSAAIGASDPGDFPATDIDGRPRPKQWPADAGAVQRESGAIVLGKSIGEARMGMAEEDVVGFYGRPSRVERNKASSLRTSYYRVHGGGLWVSYDAAARVVGIGTTSPYMTAGGLGPKSPLPASIARSTWVDCRKAFRKVAGSASVYVSPTGGRTGKNVGSVVMLQRRDDAGC